MKNRKLKKSVKIALSSFVLLATIAVGSICLSQNPKEKEIKYTYVNDYIVDNSKPVVAEEITFKRPFESNEISVYRNYYNKDSSTEEQEKSIVLNDGTYIQNTGIDYYSKEKFEVISSISGTVTNIVEDPIMGNTIEIKNNNITTLYQSISDVKVKKGDSIKAGDIIAISGKSKINEQEDNTLHFEVYKDGKSINPESIYDKAIKEFES